MGSIPHGFNVADDGTTLITNEHEQAVIADIQAMRRSGATLKKIATELTQRRIPTKTGKSGKWTHQSMARILKRTD